MLQYLKTPSLIISGLLMCCPILMAPGNFPPTKPTQQSIPLVKKTTPSKPQAPKKTQTSNTQATQSTTKKEEKAEKAIPLTQEDLFAYFMALQTKGLTEREANTFRERLRVSPDILKLLEAEENKELFDCLVQHKILEAVQQTFLQKLQSYGSAALTILFFGYNVVTMFKSGNQIINGQVKTELQSYYYQLAELEINETNHTEILKKMQENFGVEILVDGKINIEENKIDTKDLKDLTPTQQSILKMFESVSSIIKEDNVKNSFEKFAKHLSPETSKSLAEKLKAIENNIDNPNPLAETKFRKVADKMAKPLEWIAKFFEGDSESKKASAKKEVLIALRNELQRRMLK